MTRADSIARLSAAVRRLSLMSHASTQQFDRQAASTEQDVGGNRPAGGVSVKDDRQQGFALKSAEYFVIQFRRVQHNDRKVEQLAGEAERAVDAWQRTPLVEGQEPSVSSPQWKRFVALSDEPDGRIATRFGVSRQYVREIREKYAA